MTHMRANFWGKLVKSLREEKGLSQRVLAESAQINRGTLRRLENGATAGDITMVEALLDYLGYDLEALQRTSERRRPLTREQDHRVRLQVIEQRILAIRLV